MGNANGNRDDAVITVLAWRWWQAWSA